MRLTEGAFRLAQRGPRAPSTALRAVPLPASEEAPVMESIV